MVFSIKTKNTIDINKILDIIKMEYNPIFSIGLSKIEEIKGLPTKAGIAKCSK